MMPINNKTIICYDLETSGVDTNTADIWQICAIPINPRTLEILHEEKFQSYVRPQSLDGTPNDDPKWDRYKVITKGASDINHIDTDTLKDYPTTEKVFKNLEAFTNSYGKDRDRPISLGYNNVSYDNFLIERVCQQFKLIKRGKQGIFNQLQTIDLLHECFGWFENSMTGPENYKLDTLRDYFGISKDGAHNAVKDVIDTAEIFVRFLKLRRLIVSGFECKGCGKMNKVSFKGKFK